MSRVTTRISLSFIFTVVLLGGAGTASAQRGEGHTLYGDLKVDDTKVKGLKPETFHLVLYNNSGHEIARQMVASGGRYRFFDLPNGEYYISVEVENQEVARIHIRLAELEKTDVRRDIALEWQPGPVSKVEGNTVSAAELDACAHSPANEELFRKAAEHLREKQYDRAITLLKQITSSDSRDCAAWTELGTAYFRKGNADEAEKAYQRALQERPAFMPALLNLGKLRIARKNFEGAIETLTAAVKEYPNSADANFLLGEAYLQIKKGSKAVGYLYEAIRLDSIGKAEAHLSLALLYRGAGLTDKAVTEYEQFLSKRPGYPGKDGIQSYIKANKK
jgi:tetratricopeptide (TPR) repeat protein